MPFDSNLEGYGYSTIYIVDQQRKLREDHPGLNHVL